MVPTHIFKPGNMGTAERTGGTICSFSSRTWGLWMAGKKRHPISKIPLSGPSCEEFPPLQLLLCPLLLSSSLFFFNQAVWGCQVFWDEDSQPCEKLIPCGPSSLWRSSPWEHWWWLAGRWWLTEGGGMDGEMKGAWTEDHLTSRLSSADSNSAHTWRYITAVPFFRLLNTTYQHQLFSLLLLTIYPLPVNPQVQDLLMRFPSRPSDGSDGEQRGFVMWRARRVASGGWQWFTREKVLWLHCVPNLPGRDTDPPQIHPTPQPLGFNRFSLVVLLCVKATIPTDSSWAPCQGMKDMIDNNGGKTRRSMQLFLGTALAPGTRRHKELDSLRAGRLENMAHKAFSWKTETEKWMPECFACSAVFPPLLSSQSKVLLEI